LITNRFATGDPLSEVEREAENGLEFARKVRFGLASDCITGQLRLIRMLRGLTPEFGCFNDADFDERGFEQHLESIPSWPLARAGIGSQAAGVRLRRRRRIRHGGRIENSAAALDRADSIRVG